MTKDDIPLVQKWNTDGSDFLMQWSDFANPLTELQLAPGTPHKRMECIYHIKQITR